jgi:lipopolysaccharide transport system permease protein
LVLYKAYAEIRADASKSYLGLLWWILEPILYMAAFYFVFEHGIRKGADNFALFLLCGLVPWKWLSSAVQACSNSIINNRFILQQIYIPTIIFPSTVVVSITMKFIVVFTLLVIFIVASGFYVNAYWFCLPLVLLTQFFLIVAMAFIAAAFVPFLPDLRQ